MPVQSMTLTVGDENHTLQTALNHEVTMKCISITDRYRLGVIEKVLAILELQEAIPQDNKVLSSQHSQSMSRSLMDMSESALQKVFQRETMTEESQQILSGMSKKRTLLE